MSDWRDQRGYDQERRRGDWREGGRDPWGFGGEDIERRGRPGGHRFAERERRSWGRPHQVREVMTGRAEVLNPNMTVRDAARRMRAENLGAYPVGEFDRLIGMVTDRDIVMRAVANNIPPGNISVREVMSERVIYCFDDEGVDEAAELMARHQVRRIPVLNRDKRLIGMVALADIGLNEPEAGQRALRGVSERSGAPRRW